MVTYANKEENFVNKTQQAACSLTIITVSQQSPNQLPPWSGTHRRVLHEVLPALHPGSDRHHRLVPLGQHLVGSGGLVLRLAPAA